MEHWIKDIPFPPSANNLYRTILRGKYPHPIKTKNYRLYCKEVQYVTLNHKIKLNGPIALYAYFFAPKPHWFTKDNRPQRRDLDNHLKGLDPIFESLEIDDKIIFEIHAFKCISTRKRLDLKFSDDLTDRI